eukprot:2377041-Prymnesium_polylepis.1
MKSPPPSNPVNKAVNKLPILTLLLHGDFARTVSHCVSLPEPIAECSVPGRSIFFVSSPQLAAEMTVERASQFAARQDESAGDAGIVGAVGEEWAKRRGRLSPMQARAALEALVAPAVQKHLGSLPEGGALGSVPPAELLAHCRRFSQRVMHEILFSAQPPDSTLAPA